MNYQANMANSHPESLAWHETLELHELVMFQSNSLMQFKKAIGKVMDQELQNLYKQAIKGIESNLQELLPYYSYGPYPEAPWDMRDDESAFFSGSLLGFAKTSVRSYAIAISETATPSLHRTFNRQLQRAIDLHYKVFWYMYQRGYYPSYDLSQLRANDVKTAQKALQMPY
jgi:spore coat protein F